VKTGEGGLELLKELEGFKRNVYNDSAGVPMIGVGHLLTPSERNSGVIGIKGVAVTYAGGLTDQQVLDLLSQDIKPAEQAVNLGVKVPLSQISLTRSFHSHSTLEPEPLPAALS